MTLGDSKSQTSSTRILPPQQRGRRFAPRAGSCGTDHRQFCEVPWPVDLMGPDTPRAPPDITQLVKDASSPPPPKLTECGMYCNGPQDCSASVAGSEHGCFCGIPSPKDSMVLGLDPVAPVPVCLVLGQAMTNGLHGRNTAIRYFDERGLPYQCLCNATFVSERCCGSTDGVIY